MFDKMERWPNFFIVGSTKSGTSSLYYYLKQHPDIFMPLVKEPKFFSSPEEQKISYNQCITKEKDYLALFKKVKDEKILGEASVHYMWDQKSPELIHQKVPDARILISLRDPVEKCFSMYLQHKMMGRLRFSFMKEIERRLSFETKNDQLLGLKNGPFLKLERGRYYDDVKRFLDMFGKDHVKIIIFEEFIKNIDSTISEILDFLGLENKDFEFDYKIQNPFKVEKSSLTFTMAEHLRKRKLFIQKYIPSKARQFVADIILYKKAKQPKIMEEERLKLVEYFREDVQKIETLLGRKLPWTNFYT